MRVIKRNGAEKDFDVNKIYNAIMKANKSVGEDEQLGSATILEITSGCNGNQTCQRTV